MSCERCGAFVPTRVAKCPDCGKIVRPELFEQQSRWAFDQVDRRLKDREARLRDLAAASVSTNVGDLPIELSDSTPLDLRNMLDHLRIAQTSPRRATDPNAKLRQRMEACGLDADMTLDQFLALLEEHDLGVDVWTSPKRSGSAKYRCQLYVLSAGWSLQRIAIAEATTAWSALAAATVAAAESVRVVFRK